MNDARPYLEQFMNSAPPARYADQLAACRGCCKCSGRESTTCVSRRSRADLGVDRLASILTVSAKATASRRCASREGGRIDLHVAMEVEASASTFLLGKTRLAAGDGAFGLLQLWIRQRVR